MRSPCVVARGHLANAIDDRFYEMERLHGAEGARLAAESHSAAIHRIEAVSKLEKIDCDFSRLDGYLFLSEGEPEELLDRELAAAHRAGMTDVEKLARTPRQSMEFSQAGPPPCVSSARVMTANEPP